MKKIILLAAAIGLQQAAQAQKYMTRSAQVSFFSSTAVENIEATLSIKNKKTYSKKLKS